MYKYGIIKRKRQEERTLIMDSITFEKLSPTTTADVKVYKDAFDFVFANDDVRNVAISGAYGAGKSSILESYKQSCSNTESDENKKQVKKAKTKKYIHISLAHFEDVQSDEPVKTQELEGKNKISQEAMLEGKILNQLIHQIPSRKIPQTHFRVKRTIHWWSILVYSVATLAFLLSFFHILFFSSWQSYLQSLPSVNNWLNSTINPYSRLVSGGLLGLIGGLLIYTIINAQTNRSIFRKLNVNGTEIEIFENSDESYFDKYLNEVLYLFEQADADVIVFEDIDRYDDVQIFERLREINTLVNLQPTRKDGEPLRFFYMLRDDIFQSKDRTKFFDFIIPVVPIIDGSNAFNQFKNHLTANKLFDKFETKFLQEVSRYVDEMRLLKNICNEFLVYFNRMTHNVDLNYSKMFAMVIYKNLFPNDFSELQLGRGFVAAMFESKPKYINKELAAAQARIAELEKYEEVRSREIANAPNEIVDIYKAKVHRNYRDNSNWTYYLSSEDKKEYEKRLKRTESLVTTKDEEVRKELIDLKNRVNILNSLKLHEIITRDNIDEIFSYEYFDEIGQPISYDHIRTSNYFNLLKYLIRNGYIDETYSDYMTYFYGNSLSSTDKNFLISVTDKIAKEYTYELKSAKLVFENLRAVDFDEEETLNFSLLSYLLINQRQSEHLKRLIGQLREKKVYDFIYQYYVLNVNTKEFVSVLNEQWPEFFAGMIESPLFTKDVIKSYIITTLYYSNSDTLKAVNGEIGSLSNHISNDKGFLNIERPEISKLIKAFSNLGIKFKELDYSVSNKELFAEVYKNNLYEFNYANIALMLKVILGIEEDYEIIHKNYTIISQNEDSPLLSYVKDNFAIYIDLIMDNCNEAIDDSDPIACEILNHEELKKEQKERYIELLATEIIDITSVKEKAYWSTLITQKCLLPNWKNVFSYYSYIKKVNSELVRLINSTNEELSEEIVENNVETLGNIAEKIVDCEELKDEKYSAILVKSGYTSDSFDFESISEDKVRILIEKHIINLNEDTLNSFRQNYPNLTLEFIQENLGSYLKVLDSDSFDYEEMLQVLALDVSDEYKISLIDITNEPISIIGKDYSDAVAVYILKNNLNSNDIKLLFETYDGKHSPVSMFVYNYAKSRIDDIVENNMKISQQLRDDILSDTSVDQSDKASIISHTIAEYEKSELIEVLKTIGFEKVSEALIENKQPRIPINESNELLLDAFEEKGWIWGYETSPSRPDCYKLKRGKRVSTLPPSFID